MFKVRVAIVVVMGLGLMGVTEAKGPRLDLPSFDHLRSQATQSVNVSLGSIPLKLASAFVQGGGSDVEDAKAILRGLDNIDLRHFEFDTDFAYSTSDLDPVRAQLKEGNWRSVAQIRDHHKDQQVEVYVDTDGEKISGVAIIVAEPRELTIVNAVGSLDVDQVARLRKHFEDRHREGNSKEDDDSQWL